MSRRFFLESQPVDEYAMLSGEQAHHAANVMRLQPGDNVVLFDGTGVEFQAVLEEVSKKQLKFRIVSSTEIKRALLTDLTIAVALPKGDRQKFLVEKLVELGVECLIPLQTKRSVAEVNEKSLARIRKQVIEASKQCERNRLMEVTPSKSFSSFLAEAESLAETALFFGDPYQGTAISTAKTADSNLIAVGPEGGFDEQEVERLLSAKFQPVRIGPTVLRIETAAIAAATLMGLGKWTPCDQKDSRP